jgi:hypothetical protein
LSWSKRKEQKCLLTSLDLLRRGVAIYSSGLTSISEHFHVAVQRVFLGNQCVEFLIVMGSGMIVNSLKFGYVNPPAWSQRSEAAAVKVRWICDAAIEISLVDQVIFIVVQELDIKVLRSGIRTEKLGDSRDTLSIGGKSALENLAYIYLKSAVRRDETGLDWTIEKR